MPYPSLRRSRAGEARGIPTGVQELVCSHLGSHRIIHNPWRDRPIIPIVLYRLQEGGLNAAHFAGD